MKGTSNTGRRDVRIINGFMAGLIGQRQITLNATARIKERQ
jgi:hypothetical protein